MKLKAGNKIRINKKCPFCKKRYKKDEGYSLIVQNDGITFGQLDKNHIHFVNTPHCEKEIISGHQWLYDRTSMRFFNRRARKEKFANCDSHELWMKAWMNKYIPKKYHKKIKQREIDNK